MTKEGDYIVKRKTYIFRKKDIIEVEEYHDGRYGSPGRKRQPRAKPTPEQMAYVNHQSKVKRCRHKLLEYFDPGDTFLTLTYEKRNRPPTMKDAIADFQKMIRKVKREYTKRGQELRWIRNIEQGTKGAWHIHLVVNEMGDTTSIIKSLWDKGGIYAEQIRLSDKIYDDDFSKLAEYMTKDENTTEEKEDGTTSKPRLRQASYSTSRNMPLPEPKVDKLLHWKREPKPKKGYEIVRIYEGINPVTSYSYRRYTMRRRE